MFDKKRLYFLPYVVRNDTLHGIRYLTIAFHELDGNPCFCVRQRNMLTCKFLKPFIDIFMIRRNFRHFRIIAGLVFREMDDLRYKFFDSFVFCCNHFDYRKSQ